MDIERLIDGYVKLRDKKAQITSRHKEELAPVNKMMAQFETKMLDLMNDMHVTSLSAKGVGTAYQTSRVSATVADRDLFKQYCEGHDAWELADIRASKTAIRAMVEETGDLPPGINWREEIGVNFKR